MGERPGKEEKIGFKDSVRAKEARFIELRLC